MMQDFIWIISGLLLWILGAYWLLIGAKGLSLKFNISGMVLGMTLVSLVTSIPELLLGIRTVADGMSDLALKSVMGSNGANLGLLLAGVLVVFRMGIEKDSYIVQWGAMMLATTLFFGYIYFDGEIQRYEGFFMLVVLFLILVYLLWFQKKSEAPLRPLEGEVLPLYAMVLFIGLGGFALWCGSVILLDNVLGSVALDVIGRRNWMIGLLSVGLAIPELLVAIIAIIKNEKSILLGNLIGACMFNLLGVFGVSARIRSIKVMDYELLANDLLWVMGMSFLLFPLLFFSKGSQLKWEGGAVLLGIYFVYVYFTFI